MVLSNILDNFPGDCLLTPNTTREHGIVTGFAEAELGYDIHCIRSVLGSDIFGPRMLVFKAWYCSHELIPKD